MCSQKIVVVPYNLDDQTFIAFIILFKFISIIYFQVIWIKKAINFSILMFMLNWINFIIDLRKIKFILLIYYDLNFFFKKSV
jgi:hypothetical protein